MRRGLFCFLVLFILFTVSIPVHGIPPHVNFEETSPDLLSIIAFLSDVKSLCEESLQLSFDARGNLTFNKTIVLSFSNTTLTQSLRTSQELGENISYSSGYLETLRNNAESYSYLKDILGPLKALGLNVTSFVEVHRSILENLTTSVTFINKGGNATEAIVALSNIRSAVTEGRTNLQNIERYTDEIRSNYSVDTLQRLVPSLYQILETYDQYATSLLELYSGVTPHLVLYVNETVVSLGETVHVYGYFIAQQHFVSNQTIAVQEGNHTQNTTWTNGKGRYAVAIPISLVHPLGKSPIIASTMYNHTMYRSSAVFVTIQMIPTNLTFFTNATHVYVNESFRIFGRLCDERNRGIHATVISHIARYNNSVETDETGNFTAVFNETLPFGVYPMFVSFRSENIYAPCESRRIAIHVDTPTFLTLFPSTARISVGDIVLCTGQLKSLIDGSPVPQKTIEVLLNKKQVGSGTTNITGWYSVAVPTRGLHEGVSLVSARFTADEQRWRNATSNEVELTIVMGFPFWNTLIIVGVTVATAFVIFFFRKRILMLGKKEPLRALAVPPGMPLSHLPSESLHVEKRELLKDISSKKEGDIREAIISRYHLLIRFLSRAGLVFSPSSTHLDIKNTLILKGLSKNATEVITELFELAQYSPYPLGKKEAASFNTNIHVLVKTLGGDSWIP